MAINIILALSVVRDSPAIILYNAIRTVPTAITCKPVSFVDIFLNLFQCLSGTYKNPAQCTTKARTNKSLIFSTWTYRKSNPTFNSRGQKQSSKHPLPPSLAPSHNHKWTDSPYIIGKRIQHDSESATPENFPADVEDVYYNSRDSLSTHAKSNRTLSTFTFFHSPKDKSTTDWSFTFNTNIQQANNKI